jgi:hypothetical protein
VKSIAIRNYGSVNRVLGMRMTATFVARLLTRGTVAGSGGLHKFDQQKIYLYYLFVFGTCNF